MQATHSTAAPGVSGNLLLDALRAPDYQKLAPHLEAVPLSSGEVLSLPHVYFPTTAVVSLLTATENAPSEEVAVTGNEGLIGISTFLEQGSGIGPPRRAVVQHAGQAWRMRARILAEHFDTQPELQQLLLRFTQALITQIGQTVVCNRHHRIAEQLCRWLLLRLDRLPTYEIRVTQERIAHLLGVRREAVTAAATELREADIVRLGRGRITVLDRAYLERRVCECYAVIRKEYARLLLPRDRAHTAGQPLRDNAPHAVAERTS
jgi:CRP-like cAMP-binding protein